MLKPKRLLLFAYFYPPLGGPAVQRPCKTVKYLSELGWEVDVITIKNIVYHSVDPSLLAECREHKIIRTASFDPMYLLHRIYKVLGINPNKLYFRTGQSSKKWVRKIFPIDHTIGWVPFAIRAGKQALLINRYAAVMVTCGPFSSALAASRIARLGKIPLVLDYRDLWTLNNTFYQPSGIYYKLLQRLERSLLQKAELVSVATSFMKQKLLERFGKSLHGKILPVYNGWDEADFAQLQRRRKPDGKIRLAYLGTLYGDRPLAFFYQALQQITAEQPEPDWEFQLIGNFYPETLAEVQQSSIRDKIILIGQQTHADAIQMMLDADILLLVIGKEDSNWILTGKLFEYLRSQRAVLTLSAPNSEAAQILQACGHESPCAIDDPAAIKSCLQTLFTKVQSASATYLIPPEFERSQQIKNLAARLEQL